MQSDCADKKIYKARLEHGPFFLRIKYYTSSLMPQLSCLFFLLQLFGMKNDKNANFDQRLECPVPKHWSKYITLLV